MFNLVDDLISMVNDLRYVFKQFRHFRLGLEIKLVVWKSKTESFTITNGSSLQLAGIDTKQDIMSRPVILFDIVTIICCDSFDIVFDSPFQQDLVHIFLAFATTIKIL